MNFVPTGGAAVASGDAEQGVLASVGDVVETVLRPLPDWSRPIIAVLLVLVILFGIRALWSGARVRRLDRSHRALAGTSRCPTARARPAGARAPRRAGAQRGLPRVGGPAAGGDFYDAFELPGGRVAVLVGDVSGHGPTPSSARTRFAPRCTAAWRPASRRVPSRVGGRSATIGSSGQFATVVVAVHDPADGTLTYATAGHPPPIIAGRGAHEPVTTAASPPIGLGLRTGQRRRPSFRFPPTRSPAFSPTG